MKTAEKKKDDEAHHDEAHLFDSVAVSPSGCWDNDLLSPAFTQKELQVFLDGLQSGQLSGEVNWCNAWMVTVSVHLLLQSLVDLVQRAQQQLKEEEDAWVTSMAQGFSSAPCAVI